VLKHRNLVLGLVPGPESQVLGLVLGFEGQVLGRGTQVLVNNTGCR